MKLLSITFLALTSYFSFLQAQEEKCNGSSHLNDKIFEEKLIGQIYRSELANREEFFNSDWFVSDVILTDGNIVTNELIRYNGYTDQMIWLNHENSMLVILDKETVDEVKLTSRDGNISYRFKHYKFKNWFSIDTADLYLQVMVDNKVSLFSARRIRCILKEKTFEYFPENFYYVQHRDGTLATFKLKRRYLLKALTEKQDELRKLLRQEHNRVKTEEQLIRAIELYNTILK